MLIRIIKNSPVHVHHVTNNNSKRNYIIVTCVNNIPRSIIRHCISFALEDVFIKHWLII